MNSTEKVGLFRISQKERQPSAHQPTCHTVPFFLHPPIKTRPLPFSSPKKRV